MLSRKALVISRKEAKEQGLTKYFTGKPCSRGHTDERRVSSKGCITCIRENVQNWNKNNPEKRSAHSKNYQDKNKETIYNKRESERDHLRALNKIWREANIERRRHIAARRRANLRNRIPFWSDQNAI